MEVEKVYLEDSYRKEIVTKILDTKGKDIFLNKTIFYPGGGGQKPDAGRLEYVNPQTGQSEELIINYAHMLDGRVAHRVEGERALPANDTEVHLQIDWDNRYEMMKIHTALHILSSVIWKNYGVQVTGGDISPEKGKLDFDFESSVNAEMRQKIEGEVQKKILEGHKVKDYQIPREEAMKVPDLIRTKVNLIPENVKNIRIVEIEGVDIQADGGLHVKDTKEIGKFRISKTKNKGKGRKRIEIEVSE